MAQLFEEIKNLIGKRLDDRVLIQYFQDKGIKLPKGGSNDRHAINYQNGVEFLFSSEIRHLDFYPPKKEGRKEVSYLSLCWFYPIADKKRKAFIEPFPFEVNPQTSIEEIKQKFGAPDWYFERDNMITREKWKKKLENSSLVFSFIYRYDKQIVQDFILALDEEQEIVTHLSNYKSNGWKSHYGFLVKWLADKNLFSERVIQKSSNILPLLQSYKMTGADFIQYDLQDKFWSGDVKEEVYDFLHRYTHKVNNMNIGYIDDYYKLFNLKNSYEEPWNEIKETLENYTKIAPIIDKRWEEYQKTKFRKPYPYAKPLS